MCGGHYIAYGNLSFMKVTDFVLEDSVSVMGGIRQMNVRK